MAAESVQTINQLLTEMDGFEDNTGVIVMAATNRPASLDTALTRPGRFDRVIHLPLPNLQVRLCLKWEPKHIYLVHWTCGGHQCRSISHAVM